MRRLLRASSPGNIVGLQEFGLGLAVAIFVDATIVRCMLVPSLMAVLGRWNWWLPRVPGADRPGQAVAARRPLRPSAARGGPLGEPQPL